MRILAGQESPLADSVAVLGARLLRAQPARPGKAAEFCLTCLIPPIYHYDISFQGREKGTPMISIQTLQDALIALATTVGIALAITIAFLAAGALFERDQARVAKARRPVAVPAQQPMRPDQAREPVRR